MKRIFLSVFASLMMLPMMAQTVQVRPIEFELHAGLTSPLGCIPDTKPFVGGAIGMEMRYNFKNSPIDLGFTLDITTAIHDFEGYDPEEYLQDNRTVFLGFTGDYNFHQGDKVNPFVGLGVGFGLHNAVQDMVDDTNDNTTSAAFTPRVGVELWRHLRLTLAATVSCRYYHNICFSVGYVIGGGKKKG